MRSLPIVLLASELPPPPLWSRPILMMPLPSTSLWYAAVGNSPPPVSFRVLFVVSGSRLSTMMALELPGSPEYHIGGVPLLTRPGLRSQLTPVLLFDSPPALPLGLPSAA